MAYQRMQWSPDSFDSNPLQAAQGGLNMIQQAKIRELEQQQMRAKMFVEQQAEARAQEEQPLKLDFLKAQAAQMKGAEGRDADKALMEIAQVAHSNPQIAAALLQRQKYGTTLEPVFDAATPAPGTASPAAPAQGGAPIPPAANAQPTENDLFPEQPKPTPPDADLQGLMSQAAPGGGAPSDPSLQPQVPAMPEKPPAAAPQGRLLGYRLRANINGQDVVLHDPLQAKADREALAQQGSAMFKDPTYAAKYQAAVASGVPPMQAMKELDADRKESEKEAATQAQHLRENADVAMQDRWHRMSAAAQMGSRPNVADREGAAAARDYGVIERAHEKIKSGSSYKQLVQGGISLRQAAQNINTDNPALQRDAMQQFGKFFHGGVPTQGVMDMMANHMAGGHDRLAQIIQSWQDGQLSQEQLKTLRGAASMAAKEQDENAKTYMDAVGAGLGPGNGFDMYGNRINGMIRSDAIANHIAPELIDKYLPYPREEGAPGAMLGRLTPDQKKAAQLRTGGKAAPTGDDVFTIKAGPYAGKKARRLANGKAELVD